MNKLTRPCPIGRCRAENEVQAEVCVRCGTPLRAYFRLSLYPSYLFNEGLRAARAGHFAQARDLFAAVMHWCPEDREARNAFAAACLELHDLQTARQQWHSLCERSPTDTIALRGLETIRAREAAQREETRNKRPERMSSWKDKRSMKKPGRKGTKKLSAHIRFARVVQKKRAQKKLLKDS